MASVAEVVRLAVRAADLAAVDRAGLSRGEAFVVRAALTGMSLREVAADPWLVAVYGRAVSHQTAANWLAAAGGKLGLDAAEFRAVVDAVADGDRADRAAGLMERAGRVSVAELHHDPATTPARRVRPGPRTVADQLEALATELLEEAERGGGTLRAGRARAYRDRASRLAAGAGGGTAGGGGPAGGSRPAGRAGRAARRPGGSSR